MNKPTQDEVLELAKEREVFESKVKTVLEKVTGCEKYTYALNSIMIAFDTASAITAKLQEKAKSEAIYQIDIGKYDWLDVVKPVYESHSKAKRIVYLHAPSEQPQTVKDALEKAIDVCQNWINTSTFYGYTGDADNYKAIQDEIRALIDQPAEQPQELQDFNLDYTCKRIRRLLNAMSMTDPSNGNDNVLMGCLFSLLGTICLKLEQVKPVEQPAQSQEPYIYEMVDGLSYGADLDALIDQARGAK